MKGKGKILFIVFLLCLMVISFPSSALAKVDSYGLNAQAREFTGTLENWDAMLNGDPPTPYDPKATDVVFVHRKWDKRFDPMLDGELPSASGAWQTAELWEYLSGDQLGWTWHLDFKMVYSPNAPIPGAIAVPTEDMGGDAFTGFYLVENNEWLQGPHGEKTIISELSINNGNLQKALHFKRGNKDKHK